MSFFKTRCSSFSRGYRHSPTLQSWTFCQMLNLSADFNAVDYSHNLTINCRRCHSCLSDQHRSKTKYQVCIFWLIISKFEKSLLHLHAATNEIILSWYLTIQRLHMVNGTAAPCDVLVKECHLQVILLTYLLYSVILIIIINNNSMMIFMVL